MSAAFTKGPWSVGNNGHNISTVYSGQDGVASVFGVPMHTRADEIPMLGEKWAEGLANARLIAAAPELYEAVDYAFAMLSTDKLHGDEIDHFFGLAKAALAKASGQ